jgi:hypothetical protein
LITLLAKEAAMFRIFGSASARRVSVIAIGALGALLMGGTAHAQAPSPYVFPGGAGLVLNFIKPDKTADWEAMIDKIVQAMKASENPQRKAQAAAWKILKSTEQPVKDAVLYFWRLDDAPTDVEYSMVKILQELFPKEAAAMYKEYSDSYVPPAQQIFHLSLVKDFSK